MGDVIELGGMPQNRLARLRETIGWGPSDLAEFAGVSSRTIYRWESGESQIPDEQKARLCELFHVSLDHLMSAGTELDRRLGEEA